MFLGGYPEAGRLTRVGELHYLIDSSDFELSNPDTTLTRWLISDINNCYVQYKQIGSGETFSVIELVSSGC
jgi:hypothetical protein